MDGGLRVLDKGRLLSALLEISIQITENTQGSTERFEDPLNCFRLEKVFPISLSGKWTFAIESTAEMINFC